MRVTSSGLWQLAVLASAAIGRVAAGAHGPNTAIIIGLVTHCAIDSSDPRSPNKTICYNLGTIVPTGFEFLVNVSGDTRAVPHVGLNYTGPAPINVASEPQPTYNFTSTLFMDSAVTGESADVLQQVVYIDNVSGLLRYTAPGVAAPVPPANIVIDYPPFGNLYEPRLDTVPSGGFFACPTNDDTGNYLIYARNVSASCLTTTGIPIIAACNENGNFFAYNTNVDGNVACGYTAEVYA